MSNERYLEVSYFVVLVGSAAIGLGTYLFLRRSFFELSDVSASRLGPIVRRFFLFGIVAPAIVGFCSVSYISCERGSYEKVIADRSYLVQVNQAQLAAAMSYVILAVFVWCFIAFAVLLTRRARTTREHSTD